MSEKIWYTYDEIHQALRSLAHKIQTSGTRYDTMIAIGGGGFIPARILRSFLNIPIYAVTTAYYCNDHSHATRDSVQKIQWLDPMPESLKGKHVLVVDEVDDSRVTLQFCLEQLMQEDFASMGVAVLHEKIKEKKGILPPGIAYFSGLVTPDWWINYPWDADDITEHNALAAQRQALP
ncbi:phosphoribosyltransferase [Eikenella sp. Marseille-P7795]|uniref:phosphoribosyltransferase n=1 Tax=Eikenella sp. Marseille-P7795 TaxID=2866577 RepID=UPI001CE3FDB2|nr:phosphoribosyltransferase [Eikenella sp. Marseille-P7795]